MKTPSDFVKSLKNGIVTTEMLGTCMYSLNKRAKNHRDRVREYNWEIRHSPYWKREYLERSRDEYESKMTEYYGYKDTLLSYLKPKMIHKCRRWNNRTDEMFYEYFLYYECGTFSFHHPIQESDIASYDLEVYELPDDFSTQGAAIDDLLSVQFSTKVVKGLKEGTLQLAA